MNKTFLFGILATVALASLIGVVVNVFDVSPDFAAFLFVLGLIGTGVIGGIVTQRMPPPRRRH